MIGTVISYDPVTGRNEVRTATLRMTDLPMVTPGPYTLPALSAGDLVLVADGVILGRVVAP